MRRPLLLSSLLLLAPRLALGWDAEMLCSMPELPQRESLMADASAAMCSPEMPHLLRAPSLAEWSALSGRDAAEDVPEVASRALTRARKFADAALYDDALLNLRVVEATMPRIADYVALLRAQLHEQAGDHVRAARAYRTARDSTPSLDLGARAEVGYVLSLLRAQDAAGPAELDALLLRYQELPEAPLLRFELGQYRERAKQVRTALGIYRSIDLTLPGYAVAELARQRLALLAEQGQRALPYTQTELLERAERMVRSGPVELARETIAELSEVRFAKALWSRRDALTPALAAKTGRVVEPPSDELRENIEKRITLATQKGKLAKLKPVLLLTHLQNAASARLPELSDSLVDELVRRAPQVSADVRFEALVVATGTASDKSLLALADTLLAHPTLGIASRYHRARCLERSGELAEARAELMRVVETDTGTRFYAHFAAQRLRALSEEPHSCLGAGRSTECNQAQIEGVLVRLETHLEVDRERAIEQLTKVADAHGAAYPWLLRAVDLLQLGEIDAVGDELHEAYLAWRWVARRGPLRAGRVAVYQGKSVVQQAPDLATQRARLSLDAGARESLAHAAYALGDVSTAVEFGGVRFSERQPEPYPLEVAKVARKYKLDPDLLFAVMRVESVYQPRIISHAGAIGLMQIMPRTGRLIADKLGLSESTAADLLDPRFNLELSGWYLSSLLERMDGRLPLAIASYNGGPHNVRRWIDEFGSHLPLDAFLERIPFRETKRYVRRVLGYYAQYKAARGQSVDLMSMTLPEDKQGGVAF